MTKYKSTQIKTFILKLLADTGMRPRRDLLEATRANYPGADHSFSLALGKCISQQLVCKVGLHYYLTQAGKNVVASLDQFEQA